MARGAAISRKEKAERAAAAARLDLPLHARQGQALQSEATEILYGGAAGGGKSHLMRVAAILWCAAIPGLQVYLFRRIKDDLVKNHMEGPKGLRSLLAGWVELKWASIVEDEIRFWNGSRIYLCHCKDQNDVYKYQGAEIHVLLIDELTHWEEEMYKYLRHRVRMVGINRPSGYENFPRILCGANPGNVGHQWVKSSWVDPGPYELRQMGASDGGFVRQFIPARLEDNPSMAEDDPGYEVRLQGVGSEALVKALRWGDWNVVEGAFFTEWNTAKHVIEPFRIPQDWTRFRSMDWGSASPFSVGWWAVAGETVEVEGRIIPRGALVRYREWYGQGDKLPADVVASGILKRTPREEDKLIKYNVLDPSAFAVDGGPSIAEQMRTRSVEEGRPLLWRRADNKRVAQKGAISGWSLVRSRLRWKETDPDTGETVEEFPPMIYCFSTCRDSIRTIPVLQHDQHRPEDLDTDMEDHAADDWRYACASRPYIGRKPKEAKPVFELMGQPDGSMKTGMTGWDLIKKRQREREAMI